MRSRQGSSLKAHLMSEVDPAMCTGPLAAFAFMTGFVDVVSFSAIFVWCGFQTGNFAQLAIAIARLFESQHDLTFHLADQQALVSLITFNAGAFLGRIGDRIGHHRRLWLMLGTLIQALLLMVASICLWKSGQGGVADARANPSWTNGLTFVALGFMSASLGLQGVLGKRLNTQFGTTIVLTTIWVEITNDPGLFNIKRSVKTRDHRLIAAGSLFLGAFIGRAILGKAGSPAALAVGVGLRVIISLGWLLVPGKEPVTKQNQSV
ncbi:Protein of unknown function (DUF1275) domain containing protein [Amanita muscaria]|uniref:DUF1275 domain protein n=1 Tax=Amanita muscaria (strain Koide BX008) TaxID=946122 RepID=A0A0C2TVR7_AMAMK|nr:hypothetical protein M378DRAFT_188903 [Amanita muscaria Koide BX008]